MFRFYGFKYYFTYFAILIQWFYWLFRPDLVNLKFNYIFVKKQYLLKHLLTFVLTASPRIVAQQFPAKFLL